MKLNLEVLEPTLILILGTAASAVDASEKIEDVFARIGDKFNDTIEGTPTEIDDVAKGYLVKGLKALVSQLEVEGVDDDFGGNGPDTE